MATYEMLWDCHYCGTQKLLGKTHRHCPNCGAPQDPSWRYFPADSEKVAVENHVYVGADRVCPACQNPMSAAASHCSNCGCELAGAGEVKRRADQVGRSFSGETEADARRELAAPGPGVAAAGVPAAAKKKTSKMAYALFGCLGCGGLLGLVFLVFAAVSIFWTEDVSVVATGHSWQREIEVEQYKAVKESSWCDSKPAAGYDITRKKEVRSHDKIPDGETCSMRRVDNGDGTYSEKQHCTTRYRSEPVYADKCYYTIDKWMLDHTEKASGSTVDSPAWPALKLAKTGQVLGAQREGKRAEKYIVHFKDDKGREHTCEYDQPKWSSIAVGTAFKGKAGVIGEDLRCDSLSP